jgi:nitrile hydratase alpha subunit/nitrile hydratase accessory protein
MVDDTDFDVDAHAREYDPEARARALQSLLIDKEMLSTDAVDEIVATYEDDIGPLNGARVVARAWRDDEFRERLLEDGTAAIDEVEIDVDTETMDVEVVRNDVETHNLVVCTLCSCYPWAVLGLPPTWYKTPEYRSRAVRDPRGLLREDFDLDLADDVEIQVWDSTSELRYVVLPQRPPGTEDASEEELVEMVTRDSMIGVDRLGGGQAASDGGEVSDANGTSSDSWSDGGTRTRTSDRLADLDLGLDDRPTFDAPWQARAFAVAVALTDEQYPWETFQRRLVEEVERDGVRDAVGEKDTDPERAYYEQWLRALERFVVEEGLLTSEEFHRRAAEFDAGDRDAHEFVEGDPHGHVDGHEHAHKHGHDHHHGDQHDHH